MATQASELLTLGQVARRLGADTWMIQSLVDRRRLPKPRKVGPYRVIPEDELPMVLDALKAAGYLPPESPEMIHAVPAGVLRGVQPEA